MTGITSLDGSKKAMGVPFMRNELLDLVGGILNFHEMTIYL